ncbi:unnamed protein product [Rotaria sordida]|uniref:Uncharacterized protein n=1 Tax=Rotaria sordida TaxID=392033 RepID=A0A815MYY4_9BILA|nr:unnamed protein product [Rotaria sordida]
MEASQEGHVELVQYLIENSIDVNQTTSAACAGGHLNVPSLLLKHSADSNHILKDYSNCLIEAAKGSHTEIVKLLFEYPKSITQRIQTIIPTSSVDPLYLNLSNENHPNEECLTTTMSNSFPLLSPPGDNKRTSQMTNALIQLLKSLEKIVSRNILDVLQTGVNKSTKLHSDNDNKDNTTYLCLNNNRS